MTKPFQSLRHLVNRMLGSNGANAKPFEQSTLGIGASESDSEASVEQSDIEIQTADTQRLPDLNSEFMAHQNGHAARDDEFEDALLDLDGVHDAHARSNDPVLDFDLDLAPSVSDHFHSGAASVSASREVSQNALEEESARSETSFADTETDFVQPVDSSAVVEAVSAAPATYHSDMSSEAMDEIARRVVAQLSEKVVREIAWEVVPELSELLIKQRLEAR